MKKFIKNFINDYIKYPLYLMSHPIQGFDDFKRENLGKLFKEGKWQPWDFNAHTN